MKSVSQTSNRLPDYVPLKIWMGVAASMLGFAITHVMPRGPATATQALIVMVTSFAVSGVAVLVMQS